MQSEHILSSLQFPSASGEDMQVILAQNAHVFFFSLPLWQEAVTAEELYILESENQLVSLFALRLPKKKKKKNSKTIQQHKPELLLKRNVKSQKIEFIKIK